MRIDQCVCAFRAVGVSVLGFLSRRLSDLTEVGVHFKFCDNYSHDFHEKLWEYCECNPALPCRSMSNVSI